MSLSLYLFYMVLFIGLVAWGLFVWLMREGRAGGDGEEDETKRR